MAKKTLVGKIKSAKMQRTVTVVVSVFKKHPLYGKGVRVRKTFKADVPRKYKVKEGDAVRIESCRPISRDKKWRVKEVL